MIKRLATLCLLIVFAFTAFSQFDSSWSYTEALPNNYIKVVTEVESLNEIWVGTYEGIARFDETSWSQETTLGGATSLNAYDIIEASDGAVWVALGGGGVSRYESGVWTNFTIADGLVSNSIWSIAEDNDGNIWAGTTDAGVCVYDGSSWSTYTVSDGLIGNSVVEILVTKRGDIWLGTANGASIFDGTEFKSLTTNEGMPSNLVRDLYQDFNGNVCVGTSNGLGIFNGAEWTYLTTDDGLPTNNIIGLTQMHNGDFLFATDIGMVHYDGSVFSLFNYDNGLPSDVVRDMTVDSKGRIWACTPFRGVSLIDTENAYDIIRTNQHLVSNEINRLYAEGENLWVATNEGANCFNGQYWRTFDAPDGLISDKVWDIKVLNDTVYFACYGGLSKRVDQSYTNITMSDGLLSDTINSVEVLNDGTVYLGTNYGLMEIQTNGSLVNYTTADGLANDTVYVVLKDNSGNLWAGTNNGLSRLSSGTFTNYGLTELGGTVIKSLLLDALGNLYVATENSLASYISSTWNNYLYTGFSGSVTDMEDSGTLIFLLLEASGDVYYFDKTMFSFSPIPAYFNQTAIERLNTAYLYLGNNSGINRVRYATEAYNDVNISHPSCPDINDGTITIEELTDNPPYQYSIDNGLSYSGTASFSGLAAGEYHVKVKNAFGNITKDSTVFLMPQNRIDAVIDLDQILCHGDNNGVIELFKADATDAFVWSDAGSGELRENLTPGTYDVTVSDATCSVVRENTIVEPLAISLSSTKEDVACFGDNTGSVDLNVTGGTQPYTFVWDNTEETEDLIDLAAGDYTVTVSDANSCTAEHLQTIIQPSEALAIAGTVQHVQCNGEATGEILLDITGGTSPYEILWNDDVTDEDRLNITNGAYEVTVTDDHDCVETASFTVNAPDALEFVQIVREDVLCAGESNGSIAVTTQGGTGVHAFEWTLTGEPGTFSTEQNIDMLEAGEYTIVVSDENSCEIDSTMTITEPTELALAFDMTPITCQGYDDAVIEALPSNGTEPYISYYWSYADNPNIIGVNAEITDCQAGWYHVTVTDAHYCEIIDSIEIIDPPAHTVELLVTDMPCHGSEHGEIEVVVDGGATTDLSYQWSNAAGNVAVATGLNFGTYSVTITDATNCELVEEAEVLEPELGDLGAFGDNGIAYLCNGSNTVLDAGAGYASYLWSNGSEEQTIEVNSEDTYSVFVVDVDDCEYGDTVELELTYPYQNEEICFVTVDEDNHINVLWNKTPDVGTASYNIYRENPASSEFELVGNQAFSDPGVFVDMNSNAAEYDQNYKISTVDTCGNESNQSEMHSSITLDVDADLNGGCTLNWDAYEGYFVVYYFILRGTTQDNMQVVDSVLYTDFDFAQMNPDAEGVYYQIMVKRPDFCTPGDGTEYGFAYSNIVYCDNLTGIPQMAYGSIDVYPNPWLDILQIDMYLKIESNLTVRLYNSMGQLVYDSLHNEMPAGERHLEIKDLDLVPGLYNLQLHFGDQVWQQQIVKQ